MHDCVVLCFIVIMCSFKYSWNVYHAVLIKIVISKDYKVLNKAVEAKRRGSGGHSDGESLGKGFCVEEKEEGVGWLWAFALGRH